LHEAWKAGAAGYGLVRRLVVEKVTRNRMVISKEERSCQIWNKLENQKYLVN
jgi:hypothetical protein